MPGFSPGYPELPIQPDASVPGRQWVPAQALSFLPPTLKFLDGVTGSWLHLGPALAVGSHLGSELMGGKACVFAPVLFI